MSKFKELQKIFIDRIEISQYIGLDTSILFYNKLQESIAKPLKMILLYGKPGTGKSILINKIYHDLKEKENVFLISTPIQNPDEFIKTLYSFLIEEDEVPEHLTYNQFIDICNTLKDEKHITVLLDEAQLYPSGMMEQIRLISDTRVIKFVVSLHKTEKEDLIAKEHFQSRIWETIELKNGTVHDTQMYIQKKLIQQNYFEIASMFDKTNIKHIHKFTKGNYREINKLMYTLFEIYDYYENNKPSKIAHRTIKNKFIEMSALKLGYIHA
ncbi:ATP-binding protein [Hydrogenimonas urashimensis]|uniref:ATP-binding protein n=1 Tax=Hydrogenimonas urashimensis TaxID=2740515 RepID=UPI001915990C|nr:ATP-binding protein [Hydrogenimonas urashimensis]